MGLVLAQLDTLSELVTVKNKKLRQQSKHQRCLVCNKLGTDFCHIRTYSVTMSDSEDNSVYMCREHHSEQHNLGWFRFCQKYDQTAGLKLASMGFIFVDVFGVIKLMKVNQ